MHKAESRGVYGARLSGHVAIAMAMAIGLVWLTACGSDNPKHDHAAEPTSPYPSCAAIMAACHPLDTGSGPASLCHAIGHDGTEETCAPEEARCLEICKPLDAG